MLSCYNNNIPLEGNFHPPIFELTKTDYATVEKHLMHLGPSKACGTDGLTARLLRDAGDNVIIPLLHIINLSIVTKIFLEKWKEGVVTPLYKEGDPTQPNNYRPISILNACSKIAEKVIHDQLYNIIIISDFLSDAHWGSGRATALSPAYLTF